MAMEKTIGVFEGRGVGLWYVLRGCLVSITSPGWDYLYFYCSWPVFIQLLVKNSSGECFTVSLGNLLLCSTFRTMRKFLVTSILLQFKPIYSCPIPHGYGEQVILRQTYLCLRAAAVSFPVSFFVHELRSFSPSLRCKPWLRMLCWHGRGSAMSSGC